MDTSDQTPKRLSVTLSPEVHLAFKRLSSASGLSMSKAIGEWLQDTIDAVVFTADKVEQARTAPRLVARELHAYALGLADETGALMEMIRTRSKEEKGALDAYRAPRGSQHANPFPPSCNTGGKVPKKAQDRGVK